MRSLYNRNGMVNDTAYSPWIYHACGLSTPMWKRDVITGLYWRVPTDYAIHAARTLIVEPCLGFRLISGFCGKT